MARLDGKAALVTGGSRGIGRAIAERLAAEGAQVVLSYAAHKDAADDAVAAIAAAGGRGHAVPADLREPDAARLLFERAEAIAGPLRDGGRIVNISTVNTVLNGPGMAAYAASKAALELLSRVAAYEFGERNITVNSVSPGATDTEMFRTANPASEVRERIAALTALKRLGQPADVADVVALLVSEDARWLTGQNIRASGGLA